LIQPLTAPPPRSAASARHCEDEAVRNEAFYSTAAQVLPTILIALAVEANLLFERLRRRVDKARERVREMRTPGYRSPFPDADVGVLMERERARIATSEDALRSGRKSAIKIAYVFLAGELTASAVLFLGVELRLPVIELEVTTLAGPVVAIALVGLSAIAVWLPIRRLPTDSVFEEY
jgi:hypothetical protein